MTVNNRAPSNYAYGPYWRIEKDENSLQKIIRMGKLRGAASANFYASDIPSVRAYSSPSKATGNLWFYTKFPPDLGSVPGRPVWRGVSHRNSNGINSIDYAEIDIYPIKEISGSLYDASSETSIPSDKMNLEVQPRLTIAANIIEKEVEEKFFSFHDLKPREFEEIVAELLSKMGWEVHLTPQTRDGGYDILSYFETDLGRHLCLVEAKKFRSDRKVGIGLVRSLYGVLTHHEATSAMLVTTSTFTCEAYNFQKAHEHRLSLKDHTDLMEWINKYKGIGRL